LLFLQGLCNDASVMSSKFSYGISTCDEGQVSTNNDVEGFNGPILLGKLKDLRSLESPVEALLKLALENATPCAAGFHWHCCNSCRHCYNHNDSAKQTSSSSSSLLLLSSKASLVLVPASSHFTFVCSVCSWPRLLSCHCVCFSIP
jgi:hypothetical protein